MSVGLACPLVGNTDPPATYRPATSCTRQLGSTTPYLGFSDMRVVPSVCPMSMMTLSSGRSRPRLEKLNFKWSYFEAHTGLQHPDLRHDPVETTRHYGPALTIPQIAVYSSHYAVVKQYQESGTADFLLVMEDDIIFDTEFPFETFAGFCVERGIGYVRLFGKHFAPAVWLGFFYDRNIIRHRTTPTGCQAYLVSKKGAEMLTAKMREVNTAVDLAMDSFWGSQLPIYSIHPYPVPWAPPTSGSRTCRPFRQVFGCAPVKV